MSTFDGVVKEFPDIRIDYFRHGHEEAQPPLAYLLSHVHSDHLLGLETCKSPFIYCSPATREILLRLEKYPHRMNFAKGVLESRKQTYSHLKKLLKPIPLDTPTTIELSPGHSIRVTLIEANHCVGGVSFLIEGDKKAVFYTGDVRSEDWWVRSLCRHPCMIPYVPSTGTVRPPVKPIDCVYLDTTFAVKDDMYKHFPSKAEGLSEMLQKVAKYPKDTLFYFDSWTFGYEDVWQALSARLGAPVHVDDYRYRLYLALAQGAEPRATEAAKLIGFHCGNHFMPGALTAKQSQIHSCEQGTGCEIWQKDFVRITPIISRHDGMEIAELGAGGGNGDLDAKHELELGDAALVGNLIALCANRLQDQPAQQAEVLKLLTGFITSQTSAVSLEGSMFTAGIENVAEGDQAMNLEELPLDDIVPILANLLDTRKQKKGEAAIDTPRTIKKRPDGLPKQITFPYSRHSSYSELCLLIDALQPTDIHPCTVDERTWSAENSMNHLFGGLYNRPVSFAHDQLMLGKREPNQRRRTSVPERSPTPVETTPPQDLLRAEEDRRRIANKAGVKWPLDDTMMARTSKKMEDASSKADAIDALVKAARPYSRKRQHTKIYDEPDTHKRRTNITDEQPLHSERSIPRRLDTLTGHNEAQPRRLTPPTPRRPRSMRPRDDSMDTCAVEGRTVHVARMPVGTTENDLRAFFDDYNVLDAHIPGRQGVSNCDVSYGFVNLATLEDARQAIADAHHRTLNGARVHVAIAHRPGAFSEAYPGTARSYPGSTPSQARLASREDAYEAASNEQGMHWSRVGLMSTGRGHQIKEEEL